jgi:hypothetical protein
MASPRRRFGFPLLMLLGFAVGAFAGTMVAFILSAGAPRFSYVGLFDLVVARGGGLGAVLGIMTLVKGPPPH